MIFKVDVSRAFRNIRVDPVDSLKFGLQWQGQYYIDTVIAFGWMHGMASYQLLSDAIVFMMHEKGVKVHPYIDNYVVVVPRSRADKAFDDLCSLLRELGLPINNAKLIPPTTCLTCLGVQHDISSNTMSITKKKIKDIYIYGMFESEK